MKGLFSQRQTWAVAATIVAVAWAGSACYGQVESLNPNPLQPAGIGGSSSIGTYHSGSGIIEGSQRGRAQTPGLPAAPPEQRFYRGALSRRGADRTLYFAQRGAYEDKIYHPRRGSYRGDIRVMRTSQYRGN